MKSTSLFRVVLVALIFQGVAMNSLGQDQGTQVVQETYVKHMTKDIFISEVMDYETNKTEWIYKGDKPCLIDFFANWCGPCRTASPILEELAKEYDGKINIYKVNIDQEKELASVFGVRGIPAFLYCPMSGKPSMTSGIAKTREDTKAMFVSYIEKLLLTTEVVPSEEPEVPVGQ